MKFKISTVCLGWRRDSQLKFVLKVRLSKRTCALTHSNPKNQSNTPIHSLIHPPNVTTWPLVLLSYYEWMKRCERKQMNNGKWKQHERKYGYLLIKIINPVTFSPVWRKNVSWHFASDQCGHQFWKQYSDWK